MPYWELLIRQNGVRDSSHYLTEALIHLAQRLGSDSAANCARPRSQRRAIKQRYSRDGRPMDVCIGRKLAIQTFNRSTPVLNGVWGIESTHERSIL